MQGKREKKVREEEEEEEVEERKRPLLRSDLLSDRFSETFLPWQTANQTGYVPIIALR